MTLFVIAAALIAVLVMGVVLRPLWHNRGVALATVTPADCIGFFRPCGYFATSNGAQL